jgi:hypothetical protein
LPFREPALSLRDILDGIDMTVQFVRGMDFEAFREDPKTIAAVERKLLLVSEAAVRLGEDADIQFVTDERGRKVAVQIDLKKYGARLEDFWDGLISESRRKEKGIPLEKIKADLIKRAVACVSNYSVEVKPSARKELEALPDSGD